MQAGAPQSAFEVWRAIPGELHIPEPDLGDQIKQELEPHLPADFTAREQ